MQDLHSGTITRAYCRAIYEESVSRCFILPPLAGEVRRSRIGGGEHSEPVSRTVFMPCDTDSQSRNAPCVPFRGRGPRSGEGVDGGKNDYEIFLFYVLSPPKGETTHYILRVASAPSPTAVTD